MESAIYRRIKHSEGIWKYVRCHTGRGKVRVEDTENPPYYFRFQDDSGKRRQTALRAQTLADAKTEILLVGSAKPLSEESTERRISIRSAVATYLAYKSNKAPKTVSQYRNALDEFLEAVAGSARFLDEIDQPLLRTFKRFLENKGHAGKTMDTRIRIVFFMLKKNNITVRLPKDEMPTVEIEKAVAYSDDELKALFAVMTPEETIRYKFFLGSACRDKEVTFASWSDVDFVKKNYHVRKKEDVGFFPKSHESRTVPLPTSLIELLKKRKESSDADARWIFVNRDGQPDNHFLRKLKKIAYRAGLNCGQCVTTISIHNHGKKTTKEVCCKDYAVCSHFILHRFRKTCATRWHEDGKVSLRTIQDWLGHKQLETTQRYLVATDSDKLRPNIDKAFGD